MLALFCIMGRAPYRLMYLGNGSLVAIALVIQASYATFRSVLSMSVTCAQTGGGTSVLMHHGVSSLLPHVPGLWQSDGHSSCHSGFLCNIQVSFQYV
jgi:hypothetical protein